MVEFCCQFDVVCLGLLLMVVVGVGIDKICVIDLVVYYLYLDYINVMIYDFYGVWDVKINYQLVLFDLLNDLFIGDQKLYNSNDVIEVFISCGVFVVKFNLGIGYYGCGWIGVVNVNNGLYQIVIGVVLGMYEVGIEDWKVLKNLVWLGYIDNIVGVIWIYNGSMLWSFDILVNIICKMGYVKIQGLGGVFVWEFSGDDVQGMLIKVVSDGLK